MNVNNVVRTITIRGTSEGIEKLTGDLTKLAGAQENVAVVSETSARRVLSLEDAWKKQSLKLDEAARSQANIARETKIADGALREGLITQQQHAERLNLISQRYAVATVQAGKFATQTGLNRYEVLNLSRQLQDVGVSLAGGQSPFVVLTQQGSQIFDVFQATTGSVRGFFSQAIGWAGRFVASTAGVVTGVTAIGAAALYMANSFSTAQREIDKVLSGVGAASGTTRGGINRIAEGAAGGGLSVSGAREAATQFAATGKIYEQNINAATNVTRELALAMGKDATEAAKLLAGALVDPAKGALELDKAVRFLDADTLNFITTLQSMGNLQGAQNALMNAAIPAIAKQAAQVGILERAWNAASTAVSGFFDRTGRAGARTLERVTGVEGGGFTDEERMASAKQAQQSLRSTDIRGLDSGAIDAFVDALRKADAEVDRIQKRMASVTEVARFAQLSLEARDFGRSVNESTAQIERLSQGLAAIEQVQAMRLNRGSAVDPGLEQAAQIARVQLAIALEQEQVELRKAQVFSQNAAAYQNVSASTAQTMAQMNDQLSVAQAVTGAAQIEAQHRATTNALLAQGKALVDAIAIADAQRAISLAQVNAEADRMLVNLQQQGQLLQASSQYEKDRIKAAQTYADLTAQGVDSEKARAVAGQQLRNADLARQAQETADAERDAASQTERRVRAANAAAEAAERHARAAAEAARRWEQVAQDLKFLPFYLLDTLGAVDKLFNSNQGGKSQFNPEGYVSTIKSGATLTSIGNGATYQDAFSAYSNALAGGLTKAGTGLGTSFGGGSAIDAEKLSTLDRLIAVMPRDQQISATQGLIEELNRKAPSLERDEAIQKLTQSLEQLRSATDANTAVTSAMTDVLSPYYSSDPRRTNLGFRAFAGGGIMSPWGEIPINRYAGGGIADSPQVSVFGEGSTPEAYVPVPNGRIPVEMRQPANSNNEKAQRPIMVNVSMTSNVSRDEARKTGRHIAEEMKRRLG